MWYWNPVDRNEALPGIHDLEKCLIIEDDRHPFKVEQTTGGKTWSSDAKGYPVLVDIELSAS